MGTKTQMIQVMNGSDTNKLDALHLGWRHRRQDSGVPCGADLGIARFDMRVQVLQVRHSTTAAISTSEATRLFTHTRAPHLHVLVQCRHLTAFFARLILCLLAPSNPRVRNHKAAKMRFGRPGAALSAGGWSGLSQTPPAPAPESTITPCQQQSTWRYSCTRKSKAMTRDQTLSSSLVS